MPDQPTYPTLTYRFATWALLPAAVIYTASLAYKHRSKQYLKQRLGIYSRSNSKHLRVWLHCASVGEINTALPLIKALSKDEHILISTNTVTGLETLQRAQVNNTESIFMPLDNAALTNKVIKAFSPKVFFIFETELWPNIFHATQRAKIPAAILNGRISKKTLQAPKFVRKEYAALLNQVKLIIASSEDNAKHFNTLGAKNIQVLDNLKFATQLKSETTTKNPLPYKFILCASTHDDEEKQIIQTWLKQSISSHGLVIAPRHPNRVKTICQQFKQLNITYTLHSDNPKDPNIKNVYIIDTLGELAPFMQYAGLIFMGGSLVPIGGHNVLEPASMGKCILIGPHYQNITLIVDALNACKAIVLVENATQLMQTVNTLLNDNQKRITLEKNTATFMQDKKNVLSDYLRASKRFIQDHSA